MCASNIYIDFRHSVEIHGNNDVGWRVFFSSLFFFYGLMFILVVWCILVVRARHVDNFIDDVETKNETEDVHTQWQSFWQRVWVSASVDACLYFFDGVDLLCRNNNDSVYVSLDLALQSARKVFPLNFDLKLFASIWSDAKPPPPHQRFLYFRKEGKEKYLDDGNFRLFFLVQPV